MSATFLIQWIVGYYLEGHDLQTTRVIIFLLVVFFQGFVNNVLQTTLARFCFNFRLKDIVHYTSGTALSGVLVAGVALILQTTIDDLDTQYWIYLGFITLVI